MRITITYKLCLLILLSVSCTSCATLFTGTRDRIMVKSEPPGANIRINGIDKGSTPTSFKINRKLSEQTISLSKKGYEERSFELQKTFNAVTILDIFFWPGFIVDALTGSMMKASPKHYNIRLDKKE